MTKSQIMAAASAVAILAAGAASASDITGAKVSNITLTPGTNVYTVASELVTGTAANRQTTTTAGHNVIASEISTTSRFTPGVGGTIYSATLTLTGATFQNAVLDADVSVTGAVDADGPDNIAANADDGDDDCIVSATVVDGGEIGGDDVTAVFTVPNTCSAAFAPDGVSFDVPFTLNASASSASASVAYFSGASPVAFDGGADSVSLVTKSPLIGVSASADPVSGSAEPTILSLTGINGAYTLLSTASGNDKILGSVNVAYNAAPTTAVSSTIYSNLAASTTRPTLTYDVAVEALSGDFDVIELSLDTNEDGTADVAIVDGDDDGTAEATGTAAGDANVIAEIDAANTVAINTAQSYEITVTPQLSAATVIAEPGSVDEDLETIGLDGTNYLVPWVGGPQTVGNTVIRLTNSGSNDVTDVMLRLINARQRAAGVTTGAGDPIADATCSSTFTIPANGELQLTNVELGQCFGEFLRGDLTITVQADSDNLTAKARTVNAGGDAYEISLNRTSGSEN